MPFRPPWRDYHPGDLFYGVAGPGIGRNIVLQKLMSEGKIKAKDVVTIDQYDILSDVRAANTPANPLKHDPEFIKLLEQGVKTKHIVDVDLTDPLNWMMDKVSTAAVAKRKCKAGLDYITRHTVYHVHFCLQNLDLIAVANKNYDGSQGGMADAAQGQSDGLHWQQKARSITGAELRWVYRNRNDPLVQSKVQFWYGELAPLQCGPPWEDALQPPEVRSAWASYVPTH